MQQAIPGTIQTLSFQVAYYDGENTPVAGAPLLTYNLPQGEYLGIDAADIAVDFLVQNTTLTPGGNQVAYYVDGRRFRVQNPCTGPKHLKNLAPGLHRIRMELQDCHGDLLPGAFNNEEHVILVSPDKVVKSPTGRYDKYEGLPKINSIKGSMTMGQSWRAIDDEPQVPLSPAQKAKAAELTIRDGETVKHLDGTAAVPANGVVVRQGGVPDDESNSAAEAPDLDNAPLVSTKIRRGSIPADTAAVTASSAVAPATTTEKEPAVAATAAPAKSESTQTDSASEPKLKSTPAVARTTTSATTARRGGVTSGGIIMQPTSGTLMLTSGTLHVQRGIVPAKVTPQTTGSLHIIDANTSRARMMRGNRSTTGTRGSFGNRGFQMNTPSGGTNSRGSSRSHFNRGNGGSHFSGRDPRSNDDKGNESTL
jgi:hypothetical protein